MTSDSDKVSARVSPYDDEHCQIIRERFADINQYLPINIINKLKGKIGIKTGSYSCDSSLLFSLKFETYAMYFCKKYFDIDLYQYKYEQKVEEKTPDLYGPEYIIEFSTLNLGPKDEENNMSHIRAAHKGHISVRFGHICNKNKRRTLFFILNRKYNRYKDIAKMHGKKMIIILGCNYDVGDRLGEDGGLFADYRPETRDKFAKKLEDWCKSKPLLEHLVIIRNTEIAINQDRIFNPSDIFVLSKGQKYQYFSDYDVE